jgi:2-(1,2-epoxy-1,2-dihydrophenyl)acetyl-CoA isomerase
MAGILTSSHDGITTITMNRPEKLNAFAGTMREELLAAIEGAATSKDIRVVIITGAGRAFCAGGDVAYMQDLQERGDLDGFRRLLGLGARIVAAIRSMPQFVIASVNGVAAGAGCNLALACDYRIASTTASFGETFIRIGLHPDWGGSWFLPRQIGSGRALEMCLTGRMVQADEALAIGLVDRLVSHEDLLTETETLATSIASMPGAAAAALKASILSAHEKSLAEQLSLESEQQLILFQSEDARERIRAFARRK